MLNIDLDNICHSLSKQKVNLLTLSPYLMYCTESNTDSKYSLISPYLMYSTENNTDSKYSLLSPHLMYNTESNTDSWCILQVL